MLDTWGFFPHSFDDHSSSYSPLPSCSRQYALYWLCSTSRLALRLASNSSLLSLLLGPLAELLFAGYGLLLLPCETGLYFLFARLSFLHSLFFLGLEVFKSQNPEEGKGHYNFFLHKEHKNSRCRACLLSAKWAC